MLPEHLIPALGSMSHALIGAVSMPRYGVCALCSTARDTAPEESGPNEPWTTNNHALEIATESQ